MARKDSGKVPLQAPNETAVAVDERLAVVGAVPRRISGHRWAAGSNATWEALSLATHTSWSVAPAKLARLEAVAAGTVVNVASVGSLAWKRRHGSRTEVAALAVFWPGDVHQVGTVQVPYGSWGPAWQWSSNEQGCAHADGVATLGVWSAVWMQLKTNVPPLSTLFF